MKENDNFAFEYHLDGIKVVFRVDSGLSGCFVSRFHRDPRNDVGTEEPIVVQENAYYPFGALINDLSYNGAQSTNRYKHTGMETITDFSLGYVDNAARWRLNSYAPQFGSIDPLAEKYPWLSPYAYCANNPIKFVDPDGRMYGDFWDQNARVIGNDGIDDGKVYVMKSTENTKEATKFIKNNTGNTEAFQNNSIAYNNSIEIEGSPDARQAMLTEVSKDNGRGGTRAANNKEYGGSVSNGIVTTVTPGQVASPKNNKTVNIELPTGVSTFHSHPSGTIIERLENVIFGGIETTYFFEQSPSSLDISVAGSNTHYVFGRGSKVVYIYTTEGVRATLPMDRFVTPKK